jgi:hypothetical protein
MAITTSSTSSLSPHATAWECNEARTPKFDAWRAAEHATCVARKRWVIEVMGCSKALSPSHPLKVSLTAKHLLSSRLFPEAMRELASLAGALHHENILPTPPPARSRRRQEAGPTVISARCLWGSTGATTDDPAGTQRQ